MNENAFRLGSNRSCIRELFEYGQARAKVVGRENIFDFSLGNPSIPSPPQVEQAIRDILNDTPSLLVHGYTSAIGSEAVRKAISADLNSRYGCSTAAGDFFITCGAAPALSAVFGALASPGAELVALAPFFPEYRVFAEGAGLAFRQVAPDVPGFQIDFSLLDQALNERTAAVIINSPNTPSGVVYSRQTLQRLAELLRSRSAQIGHHIYLVSDEPYRELTYGTEAAWVPDIYENTLVCYSYSKSLSLPGERIGYVYVPQQAADSSRLYAAVAGAARQMGHVCAPSLWQQVIARCAGLRPDLVQYDANRKALYEGLVALGYECARPDGAFYLFVKAPGGDAVAFSEKAKTRDLLLVPGDSFGCPGYFRLCYCVSMDTITRSLPVFAALIQS